MLGRGTFDNLNKKLSGVYIRLLPQNSRVNEKPEPSVGVPIVTVEGDTIVIQFKNSEDAVYVLGDTLVFELANTSTPPTVAGGVLTL